MGRSETTKIHCTIIIWILEKFKCGHCLLCAVIRAYALAVVLGATHNALLLFVDTAFCSQCVTCVCNRVWHVGIQFRYIWADGKINDSTRWKWPLAICLYGRLLLYINKMERARWCCMSTKKEHYHSKCSYVHLWRNNGKIVSNFVKNKQRRCGLFCLQCARTRVSWVFIIGDATNTFDDSHY